MRRVHQVLLAVTAALAMGAPMVRAEVVEVQVFDFEFSVNPPDQPILDPTINVGDTVRWVWVSGLHTTTSVEGIAESWASDLRTAPFSFEHTFTQVGEFPYYCVLHGFDNGDGTADGMAGVITVVPEPGTLLFAAAGVLAWVARRRRP